MQVLGLFSGRYQEAVFFYIHNTLNLAKILKGLSNGACFYAVQQFSFITQEFNEVYSNSHVFLCYRTTCVHPTSMRRLGIYILTVIKVYMDMMTNPEC